MRISDWSSDVCSSDLAADLRSAADRLPAGSAAADLPARLAAGMGADRRHHSADLPAAGDGARLRPGLVRHPRRGVLADGLAVATGGAVRLFPERSGSRLGRSAEHTSELQSLISLS